MKTRSLLAVSLALPLLATGCATTRMPEGVDASDYRDWRVTEYSRGHLRPEDAAEQRRLQHLLTSQMSTPCAAASASIRGSFCNRNSSYLHTNGEPAHNGRNRVVRDPTLHNGGQQQVF